MAEVCTSEVELPQGGHREHYKFRGEPEEHRSGPGLLALSSHGFQVVPLPLPHEAVAHLCSALVKGRPQAAAGAVPHAPQLLKPVLLASPGAALPLPAL